MAEQDRYIAGVPCWIDLTPPDVDAAAQFYAGLFGWQLEDVLPAEVPDRYLSASLGGGSVAAIGTPEPGLEPTTDWTTYVWVDDADAAADRVTRAGGAVLVAPRAAGEAGRAAVFTDPEGARFAVWEPARHRGAEVVNQHGSVNFNDLHTADAEAAAAFYGAVFGWRVLDLGEGRMWTLPGYGEHLDRLTPGTLAGMAEMGAPAGFEDVVASIVPLEDGDHPRWGVTFGVDDADASVARATELGANVLAGPFDAPWVRKAVLRDPQGVPFTASQFVPPEPGAVAGDEAAAAA